jgi:hypothetical protein
MVIFGHAKTIASLDRRICLPCAESRRGPDADFRQRARLRGVRGGARAGQGTFADAGFGVVRAAQSLAFRALAAWRRRPIGVHALVDRDPYATMARGASHGGHRPAVPRAFQVVSDPGRRAFMDGAAVCGAKSLAGQYGQAGGCLAMVESLASCKRRQAGIGGRGASGAAAQLAEASSDTADRSRTGGVATVGRAWFSVWRDIVAGADGETIGPAIHVASAWSPVAKTTKLKTPDPFNFSNC